MRCSGACLLRSLTRRMAVLEFEELLDSSDMGPEDWLKIAATIETHYYDYDGFVVIHGTRHHPSFTMFL